MIDTAIVWVRAETALRAGRDREALEYLRQLVEVVDRIEFEYNEWLAAYADCLRRMGSNRQATLCDAYLGRELVTGDREEDASFSLCGGMLVIDPGRHVVTLEGEPIELTLTEFGMLQYLAARPGFVRTREQIISAVHGGNTILSSRTVDVHVTALRRKLGEAGRMIETVRGVGYRLSESPDGA